MRANVALESMTVAISPRDVNSMTIVAVLALAVKSCAAVVDSSSVDVIVALASDRNSKAVADTLSLVAGEAERTVIASDASAAAASAAAATATLMAHCSIATLDAADATSAVVAMHRVSQHDDDVQYCDDATDDATNDALNAVAGVEVEVETAQATIDSTSVATVIDSAAVMALYAGAPNVAEPVVVAAFAVACASHADRRLSPVECATLPLLLLLLL